MRHPIKKQSTGAFGRSRCARIASIAGASPHFRIGQNEAFEILDNVYAADLRPGSRELVRRFFLHPSVRTRRFAFTNARDREAHQGDDE
jgi:hypothetical protein